LNMDKDTLCDISTHMKAGERIVPTSEMEKQCYRVKKDLDHVAGKVEGSSTSKKFLNNEVWSLLNYIGAPTWYITFALADAKHPLCLYFADSKEELGHFNINKEDHKKIISMNPVASARFFHFVVNSFMKHILNVENNNEPGLWGQTKGYYGTVEQWNSGTVEQWNSGTVEQWNSGTVEQQG
ncbi:hypothetical protein M422DRAFT_174419, partial [Sphaerobolus stellatus SS14]